MKQLKLFLAITVLTMAASFPVFAQAEANKMASAKNPSAEAELIALDKSWTAAELRLNDADKQTINGVVADNYFGTTPFGQVQNKTQYLEALKHSDDTDVADDYRVTFFDGGKLAVMTHRGTVNGKPTYRSTHVWLKNGKGWQLIQNHVSNIGEPPAQ
jgi:Domain of unknown function (DUF4440)